MTTIDYYNQNAQSFVEGSLKADMSSHYDRFLRFIPEGGKILDLGCGSGRDTKVFSDMGYQVTAVDGSEELCKLAEQYTGQPVRCLMFDELDYTEEFDGIWACASLLHVEKKQIHDILCKVSKALKPDGILYASFKYGSEEYEKEGRTFSNHKENDIPTLFNEGTQLVPVEWWKSQDVRPGREGEMWLNVMGKHKIKKT